MAIKANKKASHTTSEFSSTRAPFTFARYSIPHEEHPERNEDTLLVDQQRGLAAVFDGVGYGPGQVASRLAARVIRQGWQRTLAPLQSAPAFLDSCNALGLPTTLQQLVQEANQQILIQGVRRARIKKQSSEDEDRHPETTAALAVFCRASNDAHVYTMTYAHVGDSRIYLLREGQPLRRLTKDDGYFSLLLRKGMISEDDALRIDQAISADELSETERSYFDRRNGITQALGDGEPTIHVAQIEILPDDRILLCTDGIHDNLTDLELEELLKSGARTTVAKLLAQRAIERSHEDSAVTIRAKKDDMSAIVISRL
ncbi:MAG TPA: PP2C family serine/threonine-protein phosphatase [Ktedonobacteraceae bacterium]|nr:PP2C family serine/threonine-protein phosphatase [Ktedonobacteraceae bacterium]